MSDLIILGTDTDAGKTTLALLWLAAFSDRWEYWKPLETGPADSGAMAALLPGAVVHPPCRHFAEPVAPLLAARREGQSLPGPDELVQAKPQIKVPGRRLLIETFGGPFSPLDEEHLQWEWVRRLGAPTVLVGPAGVGAIGRLLSCCRALDGVGLAPAAVVLMGTPDPFAREQVARWRPDMVVTGLAPPESWTPQGVQKAAADQRETLLQLLDAYHPSRSATSLPHWVAKDAALVWHPYTPLQGADPPLPCVAAEDEFLVLADGRRIIDGISSWWTILHGHRQPKLAAALQEAMAKMDHVMFAGVTHPYAVDLAEKMLATMPWNGGRAFFSDNGSTAVEVALKMAYQYWCSQDQPGRKRFVGFEHGYHGDTFGAMAVSRDPVFFGSFEPLLFQADILPLDPQRLDDNLRKHAGQVAGVILEPLVQGAGGMRMHSPEVLKEIFEVTRRRNTLFLADEVMTGCGRTGTLWAFQAAAIAPDIVATAKTLAGGMLPLAVTLAAPRIVAAFDHADRGRMFFHGHSFTGHPLACAVALASWEELLPRIPETPLRFEQFWREALTPLADLPGVQEVRIRGAIAAVEVAGEGGYLAEAGATMRRMALDLGVLLRPLGNVLYALPPWCTSDDSLARIARAMRAAVQQASPTAGRVSEGAGHPR